MGAQRKRTLHPGGRLTPSATAGAPVGGAVTAMGLHFANPLGLAAGFDRTGELVSSLTAHGFGHIEIGTVTPESGYVELPWSVRSRTRIGVNIGSAKPGLDERVIDDYVATLRRVFASADFIVANLSAPTLSRTGNTPGVETLIKRLGVTRNVLSAISGRRVPLLVKLEAGQHRTTFPAAIMAVKACALDGVVLVGDCIRRLNAISSYLEGLTVISVGGVKSVEDVQTRIGARAALVQMHRGYADGGPAQLRRILKGLAAPAWERRA